MGMFLPTGTLLYHGLVRSADTFSSGQTKRVSCLKVSCGSLLKYKKMYRAEDVQGSVQQLEDM